MTPQQKIQPRDPADIRGKPTAYEIILRRGGDAVVIAYAERKTKSALRAAMLAALAEAAPIQWNSKARRWSGGGCSVEFSGRTEREAHKALSGGDVVATARERVKVAAEAAPGLVSVTRAAPRALVRPEPRLTLHQARRSLDLSTREHGRMRAMNTAWRLVKAKGAASASAAAALAALPASAREFVLTVSEAPFQAHALRASNARIHQKRRRVRTLEALAPKAPASHAVERVSIDGQSVRVSRVCDRLELHFDSDAPSETRRRLREHGFEMAGSRQLWRQALSRASERALNALQGSRSTARAG